MSKICGNIYKSSLMLLFQSLHDLQCQFFNSWDLQVHGNVCLASVVVTQTLDWKLHAFDVLSEFDGNNEAATGAMLVIFVFGLTNNLQLHFCFR